MQSRNLRPPRRGPDLIDAAAAEALERRVLMAFGPLSDEVLVNTTTVGVQARPAVAADADGDYVVAWQGRGGQTTGATDDDDDFGIFAQRYNAAGVRQGGEFRVNTQVVFRQIDPAVAMDADGDFVIAWQSYGQDDPGTPDESGVYAQRFHAAGGKLGGEFRVNTHTDGSQREPSVAMDVDGDFVVAWSNRDDVYAKRYSAAGVELPRPAQALPGDGNEFRVNTTTLERQNRQTVAMDASGDFVIAWMSRGQDVPAETVEYGVYAQRFNAAGVPQRGEFGVNTTTAGNQSFPSAAMDDDGDFVIAWAGIASVNLLYDIYAQRYNAAATPQGPELRVNTYRPGTQNSPAAAMDADGDFVVAWRGNQRNDGPDVVRNYEIYAQRYNAAGAAQGGELEVNTTLAGNQDHPAVAMEDNGDFVVAWHSPGQDFPAEPSFAGVYARRYTDTVAPRVAAVFADGTAWQPAFRQHLHAAGTGSAAFGFQVPGGAGGAQLDELPWTNVNRVHVRFSEDVIVDAADLAIRGVNTATYALNAALFAYDPATFTATWVLAGNARFSNDKVLLDLNADAGGVTDRASPTANRLDGEWTNGTSAFPSGDGAAGGDLRFQMNFLPGDVNRNGGVVNSLDVQQARLRQFLSPGSPGTPPTTYTAFHDVDGSAFINSIDVQQVRIRQFSQLPAGSPSLRAAGSPPEFFRAGDGRAGGAMDDETAADDDDGPT